MRCGRVLGLFGAALVVGCIGTSPDEVAREALGPEPGEEGDAEHRPGQPCLVCHREDFHPGEKVFVLAGTVYLRPGDRPGLEDAWVLVTDAAGHEVAARTNEAGNFMVGVGGSEVRQRGDGRLTIPWRLDFPLRVRVRYGDSEQVMRSLIYREGSCAFCHTEEPGAASNGRVYVVEDVP